MLFEKFGPLLVFRAFATINNSPTMLAHSGSLSQVARQVLWERNLSLFER